MEKFNSERSPGIMLLAHLGSIVGSGLPVREGYEQFIRHHRRSLTQLLEEFPELGRLITVVLLWLEGSQEMLERISKDRKTLESLYGIPRKTPLTTIHQGLSDPHRGGRAVAISALQNLEKNTTKSSTNLKTWQSTLPIKTSCETSTKAAQAHHFGR